MQLISYERTVSNCTNGSYLIYVWRVLVTYGSEGTRKIILNINPRSVIETIHCSSLRISWVVRLEMQVPVCVCLLSEHCDVQVAILLSREVGV